MPTPQNPTVLLQPLLQPAVPGALRCHGGLIPHASRAGQSSRALEDAAWLAASQAHCLLHPTYEEVLTEENKYLCLPLPCLGIICPKTRPVTCTQNRCSLQLLQPGARGCQDPVRCPRTLLPGRLGDAGAVLGWLDPLEAIWFCWSQHHPTVLGAPHRPAPLLPSSATPAQLTAVIWPLAPSLEPISPCPQPAPTPSVAKPPRLQHPTCSPPGIRSIPRTPPSPPRHLRPCAGSPGPPAARAPQPAAPGRAAPAHLQPVRVQQVAPQEQPDESTEQSRSR